MPTWRSIDTGPATGAHNMAVDEVLLEAAATGAPPVLRLYGWRPPAVTLGYGQRAEREIDLAACRAAGVDVVRRVTGGRAVLHWNELTYSVICHEEEEGLAGTVEESHRHIAGCLAAGMRDLGVPVELERGARRRRRATNESALHHPCFASTARWEVTANGRKLIGSAQRRVRGALLQHGSVLLGPEHLGLVDLLAGPPPEAADLAASSTDLSACLGRPVSYGEVAGHVVEGFRRQLAVELRPQPLTAEELARARDLERDKYGDPDFTAGPGAAGPARAAPSSP